MKELKNKEIVKIEDKYYKVNIVVFNHHKSGGIKKAYLKKLKYSEELMELPLEEIKKIKNENSNSNT